MTDTAPSPKEKPTGEIAARADEIRAKAAHCATVLDLARAMSWPIQSATSANETLELGLPYLRTGRAGKPRPGVAVPKPAKKSGGGK